MNPSFTIETSRGDFTVELFADQAPVTVANFCKYVQTGHYVNTIFHRLVYEFVIQGGGYTEDLQKKPTDAPIKNEAANGLKNRKYTLAMARQDEPDSATSQFFINLEDNENLDHVPNDPDKYGYSVFGRVSAGFETIERIRLFGSKEVGNFKNVPIPNVVIRNIVKL